MKHAMILTALLLTVGSASATNDTLPTQPPKVDVAQQQAQNTAVTSNAVAGASNQGNNQTIVFSAPTTTSATVNTTVAGSQTVVQAGGTNNTNVIKQEQVGVIKQDVNQTVNSKSDTTINGKQEQIVSGGTNNTLYQTYGSQTIKNTPSVSGPPLTSSNDTCMGSASGSVNAPGFGLSLGKTYTDDNCVMLKNSRELWNMGMKGAAMALMCQDANNRRALEITGYDCPGGPSRSAVHTVTVQQATAAQEPTDKYIRMRQGLPAIKE